MSKIIPQTPGIYVIGNSVDNNKYIGSAVDIRKRLSKHKSDLKLKKHDNYKLQDAWNLLGEECFYFDVLEETSHEDSILSKRESFYINLHDTYKNGYNLTEHTNRVSIYKTLPATQYSITGVFIKNWESIREAAAKLKIDAPHIIEVCNGKRRKAGDFHWKYKTESDAELKIDINLINSNPILQYTKDGIFVQEWISCNQAAKHFNTSFSRIKEAIVNKSFSKDFIWIYKNINEKVQNKIDTKDFGKRKTKIVLQFDLNNNFIKEFGSVKEAEDEVGVKIISAVCRGVCETAAGYKWKYKDGIIRRNTDRPILQFDVKTGFLICEWKNIKEAIKTFADPTKKAIDYITRIAASDKKIKFAYGFIWEFKYQDTAKDKPVKIYKPKIQPTNSKPILQYTLKGEFVQEFISQHHAARFFNIHVSSIQDAVKRKGTSAGHFWMLKENNAISNKIQPFNKIGNNKHPWTGKKMK